MREARDRYFRENGFGEDGGYGAAWVDFKLGPIPMPFPNTPGRVRAVRYHDLHHVLTGYATDTRSEFEISAYEVGVGCGSFYTAWAINLLSADDGRLLRKPRRTYRASVWVATAVRSTSSPSSRRRGACRRSPPSAGGGVADVTFGDVLAFAVASVVGAAVSSRVYAARCRSCRSDFRGAAASRGTERRWSAERRPGLVRRFTRIAWAP
ncbi:MAG: hypothetical protein R3B99_16880 [Polyangiales bacterium]